MCSGRAPFFLLATWLLLSLSLADTDGQQSKVRTGRSVFNQELESLPGMDEEGLEQGTPGEHILFFKPVEKVQGKVQQEHKLAKRFNEFVGKRTGNSRAHAWTRGVESETSLVNMIGGEWGVQPRLPNAAKNKALARALETKLAEVMRGTTWKDLKTILKSKQPQVLEKDFDDRTDRTLNAMWKPYEGGAAKTGVGYRPIGSGNFDTIFPLPKHNEQAPDAMRYAEFPILIGQDSPKKRWAEFPGKRSNTPAMKRYAEFLGKRSVAISNGAQMAKLEKDLLESQNPMILENVD